MPKKSTKKAKNANGVKKRVTRNMAKKAEAQVDQAQDNQKPQVHQEPEEKMEIDPKPEGNPEPEQTPEDGKDPASGENSKLEEDQKPKENPESKQNAQPEQSPDLENNPEPEEDREPRKTRVPEDWDALGTAGKEQAEREIPNLGADGALIARHLKITAKYDWTDGPKSPSSRKQKTAMVLQRRGYEDIEGCSNCVKGGQVFQYCVTAPRITGHGNYARNLYSFQKGACANCIWHEDKCEFATASNLTSLTQGNIGCVLTNGRKTLHDEIEARDKRSAEDSDADGSDTSDEEVFPRVKSGAKRKEVGQVKTKQLERNIQTIPSSTFFGAFLPGKDFTRVGVNGDRGPKRSFDGDELKFPITRDIWESPKRLITARSDLATFAGIADARLYELGQGDQDNDYLFWQSEARRIPGLYKVPPTKAYPRIPIDPPRIDKLLGQTLAKPVVPNTQSQSKPFFIRKVVKVPEVPLISKPAVPNTQSQAEPVIVRKVGRIPEEPLVSKLAVPSRENQAKPVVHRKVVEAREEPVINEPVLSIGVKKVRRVFPAPDSVPKETRGVSFKEALLSPDYDSSGDDSKLHHSTREKGAPGPRYDSQKDLRGQKLDSLLATSRETGKLLSEVLRDSREAQKPRKDALVRSFPPEENPANSAKWREGRDAHAARLAATSHLPAKERFRKYKELLREEHRKGKQARAAQATAASRPDDALTGPERGRKRSRDEDASVSARGAKRLRDVVEELLGTQKPVVKDVPEAPKLSAEQKIAAEIQKPAQGVATKALEPQVVLLKTPEPVKEVVPKTPEASTGIVRERRSSKEQASLVQEEVGDGWETASE
ncbi:hypothetical protein BDW74DRAFT_181422 [Aspergillus multicolor]|uniref:uncharacterized protein n=1 Tax=Aspergillus multicolor TaxID=41759 RepID=UPI003CCE07E8